MNKDHNFILKNHFESLVILWPNFGSMKYIYIYIYVYLYLIHTQNNSCLVVNATIHQVLDHFIKCAHYVPTNFADF